MTQKMQSRINALEVEISALKHGIVPCRSVGEAGTMPGTSGFTMAVFNASDVPVGTKLYTEPQGTVMFDGPDDELVRFLDGVVGVIESTSCERSYVYEHCVNNAKRSWGDGHVGIGRTIGLLAGMPIHVSIFINEISGHKIAFVEATSTIVDYDMVRKWLEKVMPRTAFDGDRLNFTDATNWLNVIPRETKGVAA